MGSSRNWVPPCHTKAKSSSLPPGTPCRSRLRTGRSTSPCAAACGANLRSAWLGMPFGDRGLVIPSRSFAALGGFKEDAPYGEDYLLAWAARRAGIPLRRIDARLFTSTRKYERGGWAATTGRHLWLTAAQAWSEWRRLRGGAR